MYLCNQDLRQTQEVAGDAELLHTEDILPDNFDLLAPEDKTVEVACLFSRRAGLTINEQQRRCLILTAWETGALDSFSAHHALLAEGLLDFDLLMGMYAGFVRAVVRAEAA